MKKTKIIDYSRTPIKPKKLFSTKESEKKQLVSTTKKPRKPILATPVKEIVSTVKNPVTIRKKKEYRDDTGLILGDLRIEKLSGPVSMSILRPKKDVVSMGEAGFDMHYPIFLNLGDIHHSKDLNCEVVAGSCDKPSCYEFDIDFIQELDNFAGKNDYNIDLYVEDFSPIDPRIVFGTTSGQYGYMEELFIKNMDCFYKRKDRKEIRYGKDLSKIHKLDCKTDNVKWHFTDPRKIIYNYGDDETVMYIKKNNFVGSFINVLFFTVSGNNSHEQKVASIKTYFKNLTEQLLKISNGDMVKYKSVILPKIEKILHAIFVDQGRDPKLFTREVLFGQGFKENSLIYKQFMKQHSEVKDVWESFIQSFVAYWFKKISSRPKQENGKALVSYFMDLLEFIDEEPVIYLYDLFLDFASEMSEYILDSQLLILDVYFLLRAFKIIPEKDKPDLIVSILGERHTKNINYFLTDIMELYEKITIQEIKDIPIRCMYINKSYNLQKMILENRELNQTTKKAYNEFLRDMQRI